MRYLVLWNNVKLYWIYLYDCIHLEYAHKPLDLSRDINARFEKMQQTCDFIVSKTFPTNTTLELKFRFYWRSKDWTTNGAWWVSFWKWNSRCGFGKSFRFFRSIIRCYSLMASTNSCRNSYGVLFEDYWFIFIIKLAAKSFSNGGEWRGA